MNYPNEPKYTCPNIDKSISQFRDNAKDHVNGLYDLIVIEYEDLAEELRTANQELRDYSRELEEYYEDQIKELKEEYEEKINELNQEIESIKETASTVSYAI